ncbi:hypothetical protein MWU49_00760 [Alcanivorax sp. S6407]|uniref:HTH-like domain-containing protein n=1 Tax=Alcanivorax sp. S6407 TaxID=2926424 RepID=UPI001FF12DAB|nr:hypothetical protein [Alcanivorax sp. S6407]MCK0152222.1 hypothetical protein [Alcanivorax sp. S6407]
MTIKSLGAKLREKYLHAPKGEKVTMIHLFAIESAQEIIDSGVSAKAIVAEAGINDSYATEVSKGVKLSKYVRVN